ncbi:hypothetical protein DIQ79_07860 [Mycolicibacterium smegmatis]|uniref:Uncharacterized protein n=1 Tax=Mycolicibacterium smegmatis (strain ATCC 700084 / mc(2)155) TaxID=246196 RepID=A0R3N4_MYCS2|nr:hypothetical protein MSMEG_5535 [Mycolicibacterium smegmatis MC2 155]TBM51531.1 hypothetical protein DIQ86_04810 [Mycolicibacterium smegmatis]TBH49036.1 hypothetical protein EYS45_06380 [Mycolicibacterium smegmatis MC2 155]TBM53189.1 hypothetical protein DIQ85_07845 [Mycolicibacterium smegmatis]TBM64893.1 hypothetical protein DIQ83_07860 [Mycolicibacterium smegmatis]
MEHRLTLLRVQAVQELVGFGGEGGGRGGSHLGSNLPRVADILCDGTTCGGTLDTCSLSRGDFSTGTGLRCPWSSCLPLPSPAVRIRIRGSSLV